MVGLWLLSLAIIFSSVLTQEESLLLTTYQDSLSTAMATFSHDIYVHLAQTSSQDNFVFSPLSLHSALSLLYLATTDNSTTQDQLGATLGIINNKKLLKVAYKELNMEYKEDSLFLLGYHIWIGEDISVHQDFKDTATKNFGSEISEIDFKSKRAVNEVNGYVRKRTESRIKNLMEKSFLKDTQLFLTNALFFKEDWQIPFKETDPEGKSIEAVFNTAQGRKTVPMMWQVSDQFNFRRKEFGKGVLDIVTIPYANKNFVMQLFVSEGNKHFTILENMMEMNRNRDRIEDTYNLFIPSKIRSNEEYDKVNITLPKFNVNSKLNVAKALETLGAKKVFTSGAELDKINAGKPVSMGNIFHGAVVEVNTGGTEGSAATGIELRQVGENQKDMIVDRPFIFIIHDKINNVPLLVGRIKNPRI